MRRVSLLLTNKYKKEEELQAIVEDVLEMFSARVQSVSKLPIDKILPKVPKAGAARLFWNLVLRLTICLVHNDYSFLTDHDL